MSCFQGRYPFLKFCFPQINAAGSSRGLRVPGDWEGCVAARAQGSHFLDLPGRHHHPSLAPPRKGHQPWLAHLGLGAAHSHPRQSLPLTCLGIMSSSANRGGIYLLRHWGNNTMVLHNKFMQEGM